MSFKGLRAVSPVQEKRFFVKNAQYIDHVNLVYNKCDLVISFSILAGKILHWSYGNVDILCHNFLIKPRIMKVKAAQVLRCAPFHHIKS